LAPPRMRGRNQVPPMSPERPTSRKAVLKRAVSSASRRSQADAQPSPAPAQAPLIAAIVTSGHSCRMTLTVKASGLFARFNTAFLDVGLSGDMGGTWFLPRILGGAKARELYFLPGKFDAAEAARIGLVSRVVPEAAFETELTALTERLANASPLALKGMKANFVEAEHMGLADFIANETSRHTTCGRSEDSREAFRAFVEKRKPVFQGR
jgi:2-(1,2-epoxy-1,2-dihydrophenyl)acetyl-CoA isomerase